MDLPAGIPPSGIYDRGVQMNRYVRVLAGALLCLPLAANAATLRVGSAQKYKTLQAASDVARDGDVIEIDAGVYTTGATWYDNFLTIRPAPGVAAGDVIVRGGTVQGKALFVTAGDNILVNGIRFEDAAVPHRNGAGIRAQGNNLTVVNSEFVRNENGILATGSGEDNVLTISNSRFVDTRSPAGDSVLTHAVYVGKSITELVVEDSYFTRTTNGHHVKSRAMATTVRDSVLDDGNGTTSYLIEASEGGQLIVVGNTLVKGPNARNPNAIAFGTETHKGGDYVNPPSYVFIGDNKFTSRMDAKVKLLLNRTDTVAELHENDITVKAGSFRLAYGPHVITTEADQLKPIEAGPPAEPPVELPEYAPVPLAMSGAVGAAISPHSFGAAMSPRSFSAFASAPTQSGRRNLQPAEVPAPGSLALFALGGAALALRDHVRRRAKAARKA